MADIIKKLKKRNNIAMLIILIIGAAIIAFSSGSGGKTEVTANTANSGEEERLEEILSEIDGAGQVSVMITYESTMEKDIAYDGDNDRAVTSGGDVMVKREIYPKVKGVIVIADGADTPSVKQAIKEAVTAVTGAGANRVCVFSRGAEAVQRR